MHKAVGTFKKIASFEVFAVQLLGHPIMWLGGKTSAMQK